MIRRTSWLFLLLLLVGLLLAGCVSAPETVEEGEGAAPTTEEVAGGEAQEEKTEQPVEPTTEPSIDEKVDQAAAALAKGDYVRVLVLCSKIYAASSDLSFSRVGEVRLLHARALHAMGDAKNGLPLLAKLVRDGVGGMETVHAYVPWAMSNGQGDEAIAVLEGVLEGAGDGDQEPAPELFAALGWLYLQSGKTGLASERLDHVAKRPETEMMLALARFEQGEYAAARTPATQVWKKSKDPSALVLLGDLQRMEGRTSAAVKAYGQALKAQPGHYGATVSMGVLRMGQGDVRGAANLFEGATQTDPERPEAWTNLGLARRALGDFDGAAEAYRTALDKRDNFASALKNMGILNEKYLGRPADAIPYYEKYLQVVGEDEEVKRWIKAANRLIGEGSR